MIPNSDLFTQSVTVNTVFDTRRLQYDFGIGYGDDIARAKAVILEALKTVHGIIQDPPPEALVDRPAAPHRPDIEHPRVRPPRRSGLSKIEPCDPTNLRCAKYGQGALVPHQFEPVESLANFREIVCISHAALRIRHGQVRVTA